MTWSYVPTQLATSTKDQVRLLIGDVLSTDPQMSDEEVNFAISNRGSILGAAADCCRALAAKFARSPDQKSAALQVSFSQMSKQYALMAVQYEAQAAMGGAGVPYAGGISLTDKLNQEQDGDRVSPQFTLGMEDDLLPLPPVGPETMSENQEFIAEQEG